jgi:sec-independent protein translocase protein TatC
VAVTLRRRRRDRAGEMTLIEHLSELRNRLFITIGAVALGAVAGWFLYAPVFRFLRQPFCDFMVDHPQLAINPDDPCRLVYSTPTEPFLLKIKVVLFLGLAVALPVVLYELWRFVTPGLTQRERRYAIPFVVSSVFLFILGAAFAFWTLPRALNFLLGFAGTEGFVAALSIDKYIGFTMLVMLAFGLSFEFPVVLISLCVVGVLSSRQLAHWRHYAILFIAVAAAVITPSQDFVTMTAMMIPLIIFYELSIWISRALKH